MFLLNILNWGSGRKRSIHEKECDIKNNLENIHILKVTFFVGENTKGKKYK